MKRIVSFTATLLTGALYGILVCNLQAATAEQTGARDRASGYRFDVTQFGAIGDGKTDDTAAIQAAFDACWHDGTGVEPYGGIVEFPGRHTFLISKTINVYDSCRLEGTVGAILGNGPTSPPEIRWRGLPYGGTTEISRFMISQNVASIRFLDNASPGQRVEVNGMEVTFVASGARGDQVNIGSSAADTAAALTKFLNSSSDERIRVSQPFANSSEGVVSFKYQFIGLNGKRESVRSGQSKGIAVRPALYPASSPTGGRAYPYKWLATFTANNSLAVGDWVYINGFKSQAGMTMNNLVSAVLEATPSSFTVFIPEASNAPAIGSYSDSATATSISVDFATDSYSRYEESLKDIQIVGGGVGIYLGSRVDTGTHFQNTWLGSQSYFNYYFSGGGLNVDFDKGWRGDGAGVASIYWRVSAGDNLGIANGQTSTGNGFRGAAVMLDNQGCNGRNNTIRFSARSVAFEAGADYAPGLGSLVLYDCTSSAFPEQFAIDMESVNTAWDYKVTYAPTIVMTPPNDTALSLSILNGAFTSSKSSPRWVGVPGLLRADGSADTSSLGNQGIIPSLSYAPSFKSIGGTLNERNETALSQCLGDCNFGQLWQYGVQASALLYSDTAFTALPNGTTLFAGQIIAPPNSWKAADSNRYTLNVVKETGTTGIPNHGATTCMTDARPGRLVCTSAIDLSVGQHVNAGTLRDATITHLDASDPGAVLVTLNKRGVATTTAVALAFSAPGLGAEIELPAKGTGKSTIGQNNVASGGSCEGCSGTNLRAVHAFCAGAATPSSTLGMFGAGAANTSCTSVVGTETVAQVLMNASGTVSNLAVRCAHSGAMSASGVFTVWDLPSGTSMTGTTSGVNTGLTVTYGVTAANTPLFDSTHTFKYEKGDLIRVQFTTQAKETLGDCEASFNY